MRERGSMVRVLRELLEHPALSARERAEARSIASTCGALDVYAAALPQRTRAILASLVTAELIAAAVDAGIEVSLEGNVA